MDFEIILRAIENYGPWTTLGIITAIILSKFLLGILKVYSKNNYPLKKITKLDLKNHEVFFFWDRILYLNDISKWEFKDDFRKSCVTKSTKIFFRVIKKKNEKIIESNFEDLTRSEFRSKMLELFAISREETVKELKEEKIPQIFIDKFYENLQPLKELLAESLEGIFNSNILENNLEVYYEILNSFKASSYAMMRYAEKNMININGDLKGLTYNGFTAT